MTKHFPSISKLISNHLKHSDSTTAIDTKDSSTTTTNSTSTTSSDISTVRSAILTHTSRSNSNNSVKSNNSATNEITLNKHSNQTSKLGSAASIVKATRNLLDNHSPPMNSRNSSSKSVYIPWYLKQSTRDLASTFKKICNIEDERIHEAVVVGEKSPWSLHLGANNGDYNRYTNVLPWDSNSVKLPVIDSAVYSDYINASRIKLQIPEISHFNRYYIATQGPMESTAPHFWQMCYHESDPTDEIKPIVIIMVTSLQEANREKCFKYWPDGELYDDIFLNTEGEFDQGFPCSLVISLKSKEKFNDYEHTQLLITPKFRQDDAGSNLKNNYKPKIVHHFYYHKWGDFSQPDENGADIIKSISEKAWKINNDENLMKENKFNENPIYVHCSAGVGRTGTFITLDYLLNCSKVFKEPLRMLGSSDINNVTSENGQEEKDPILCIVSSLRKQRMMTVQSRAQFLFLYDTAELEYKKKIEEEFYYDDDKQKN